MIVLTVILALGMVSLVFYRSQSVVEPTAAALVIGDVSLDGAHVTVFAGEKEIASATLSADNGYRTPILLQPGLYELQVLIRGKTLLFDRFNAPGLRCVTFALPAALVVQGNASLDGAVVQVTPERDTRETSTSTVLNADNGYAAITYHSPGTFHLNVKSKDQVIRDQSITIEAHKPRRISLLPRVDDGRFSDQND
jgi:hypothetical protein